MTETPRPEALIKTESTLEKVVFKGYKHGLTLVIPDSGSFEGYIQETRTRLEQSQDFFKGASIVLDLGKRLVTQEERGFLIKLMKEFGLKPRYAEDLKRKANLTPSISRLSNEADQFKATITIKKTVRSGQRISFEGNIVIMGDVNPGAEVVASGDIIVLGKLRGTAHAGAEGDDTAQIIAFQLRPVQIRIAGVISRDSEPSSKVKYMGPEVARIKDGMVLVERISIN